MIICGECGAGNDDGVAFCGTCGKYLEFVTAPDEKQTHAPDAASEAAPEQAAAGAGPASAGPAVSPSPDAVPLVVPVDATRVPGDGQPVRGPERPTPEPAAAPVLPGAPGPAAAPVRPGAPGPRRRPSALPPEERKAEPGELICGHCGAGNVPTRRFCRRCGTDLVDAPVVPPPPWWRRLLRSGRDRQAKAGERHRRVVRRSYRGKVVFLVVLALLAGAGWTYRNPIKRVVAAVVDRVGGTSRVDPLDLRASTSARDHGVKLLRDANTETFWAPAGRDSRPFVDVRFREGIRLVAVVVFNGASRDAQKFEAQGRPRTLRFTFRSPGKAPTTRDVVVKDEPRQQDLFLGVDDVTGLRITVLDSVGMEPGRRLALAELEFRQRAP